MRGPVRDAEHRDRAATTQVERGAARDGDVAPWWHDDDPVGRHVDAAQVVDEALRRDDDPGRRAVRDAVESPLRARRARPPCRPPGG